MESLYRHPLLVALVGLTLLCLPRAAQAAEKLDQQAVEFFEKKIRPVLVEHCYKCHSAAAAKEGKLKGNLQLDTRAGLRKGGDSGPAVVPGDSKKSHLLAAIQHDPKVSKMPPRGRLADEVIADFVKWIEQGAADPREGVVAAHRYEVDFDEARQRWAFQLPKKSAVPKSGAWARTDIDQFIHAKLQEKGLKPVADAVPRVLLRRIHFDLVGLPPTPEEIDQFEKAASRKLQTAVEELVDRLLASPQFGERWGRHWLDVVRYAEDAGGIGADSGKWPYAWRYRRWVIDALNADKPYNQFVLEQLAGDLLPIEDAQARQQAIIATGLQTLGPRLGSAEERLDDRVDVLGRALWGVSIGCCRCHDHKFDPLYRSDYLAFVGIFANSTVEGRLNMAGGDRKAADAFEGELRKALQSLGQAAGRYQSVRTQLAKVGVTYVPGMSAEEVLARVPAANRGKIQGMLKDLDTVPVQAHKALEVQLEWPPVAMGVKEATQLKSLTLDTRTDKGIQRTSVPRGLPRVMVHGEPPAIDQKTQSGRLQAARWAASDRHPLTARVHVNRVWYHLFGRGIVATVDNFGATGETPTHSDLLDTLAAQFMEEGWSTKKLIRKIVLSRTYQLASTPEPANAKLDDQNQWFWRANRRRLEAEAIRDAILACSGKLDRTPPFPLQQAAALSPSAHDALDDCHRSVYLPVLRADLHPLLKNFDGAEPTSVVGNRGSTNVPTQALYLLNSNLVLRHSRRMAELLLKLDEKNQLSHAYLLAYGRPPSPAELERDRTFLKEWQAGVTAAMEEDQKRLDAWTALCQTLIAGAEFRYTD